MRVEKIGDATLMLGDCMDAMREMPDKAFDLAIVDPPYGDGGWGGGIGQGGSGRGSDEYFDELFRVSKFQVIWGGNYFNLPPSRNFLVWRKLTISETFSMAMAEYAWTNIPGNAKVFDHAPQDSARFHPTQKPVALYRWILSMFAKHGDKIIDTHFGSGSCIVACAESGYESTGIEINEEYFNKALPRVREVYKQPRLFDEPRSVPVQQDFDL